MDLEVLRVQGLDVVRRVGVPMRARDGTTLVADLWHPEGPGPWPGLLVRTAYGRAVASAVTAPHPAVMARAGYVVATQDVRGRGDSGGDFVPFAHEADDGADAVDWLAQRPECDGRVGMYGFSYQGYTQLAAASRRPRALRAVAPAMCSADPAEGFLYHGGILRLGFAVSWASQLSGMDGFVGSARPAVLAPRLAAGRVEGWPWWDLWGAGRCGPVVDVAEIAVPALVTAGWWDTFSAGTVTTQARWGGPTHLVGGPWWHMPWSTDAHVATDAHLAFFDRHVAGRNGSPDLPPARTLAAGGSWRDWSVWPPTGSRRRFGLSSGGRAASRWGDGRLVDGVGSGPPDISLYEPAVPVPSVGLAYGPDLGVVGPARQDSIQDRTDVLVYTGEPLAEPVELAGSSTASIDVASDAPDHDACATLCVVDPDGGVTNVAFGAARGVGRIDVALSPVHVRVPAGYRLRLAVAPSAFPELAPNRSHGWAPSTRALSHSGSWLDVPVAELPA